ncbi:restriction endonuclease subunit S [Psychrobacter alimentarius]|uniref:restriction endonuclease subunit S n=1 Tax=Psychrobacter alimentarius TaxID=261164 RepID=UPI003FD38E82
MVPNGWKEGKVKDLVKSLNAGVSVNSEDDGNTNSEFKILKTSCVSNGVFQPEKAKSVVESNEISRLKEPVKADSIIISRMNTPALVGANGYVENEITNSFLPDRLWQVKPRDNKVNMKWLGYWFSSSHTRYALSSTATGTSGSMKNITKPDVLNIKIDIPPLPEQQKIAKILSTWDKAISTTKRLIENSTQQKKALMQQLLTGKKRLLDESGQRFEGEWEEIELGDICSRVMEKNNGQSTNVVTISAQQGLIRQEEFFKKSVASEILDNYYVLRKGQFAYNKSYSNGYPMGAIKRLNRYEDGVVTTLYICFEIKDHSKTDTDFLEQYFDSGLLNRGLTKVAAEGGRAHGLLNVKPSDFMALKFKFPTYPEQQKIATVLTNANKEIELLEQQLADLQQEKKALMQVLLTGKKRVVVDGEVA